MTALAVFLLAPVAWLITGAAVLAWWDAEARMNGQLSAWLQAAPIRIRRLAWLIAAALWPYFVGKLIANKVHHARATGP